jgi:putative flippase GtrA
LARRTGGNLKKTVTQFLRYAIVGLASNAVGYFLYLGLTGMGMGHKLAMSLLYGVGVLQTFIFNKRWTFQQHSAYRRVFMKYCISYGFGYVINLIVLFVLVDRFGYPHEVIQGFMILTLAIMLFFLQKHFVFKM